MAETQREPVPRVDTGELETALAFLDFSRSCMLKKAAGLSDEQLQRVLVDSGTSILGLVRHLTMSERWWFGYHLLGLHKDHEWDFEMTLPVGTPVREVLEDYRAAIDESNAAIRSVGDPTAPLARQVDGERLSVRWMLAHMGAEVARHVGHADILREQLDGTTGR
ncbi:DinB family protein [Kineococcus sp. SYSU DK003]|uniref:DinB family protein n=1 Tax=Kineococcus sp. SYSU DK003 TaxID=3383124 RepID=UPI003D7D4C63